MSKFSKLFEAPITQTMSDRELNLHEKIRQILIDDGHGAHHKKFAELFQYFDVNIISIDEDPECTAYMDDKHYTIGIGEGFVFSPAYLWQLGVIVRHELAHFMLRHTLKYMQLLSKEAMEHFNYSRSVHGLLNIIADFEISNKVYSVKDKGVIRKLMLNGKIIQGLVTEDSRSDWKRLSIEQMYKKLEAEIYADQQKLNQLANSNNGGDLSATNDYVTANIRKASLKYAYMDTSKPRFKSVPNWLAGLEKTVPAIKNYPDFMKKLFASVYAEFADESEKVLEDAIKTVKDSAIIEPAIIKKIKVFTPEEKLVVLCILASILHKDKAVDDDEQIKMTINVKHQKHSPEYVASYNDTIANLSDKDINTLDLYQVLRELEAIIKQNHEENITGIIEDAAAHEKGDE